MRQSTLRKILRRRGSVLILVVALLVLLALVGTAYLTTTRFDRSAAVANTVNTQKDFSIQSAINVVQANVLDDILDPQAVNQGESTTVRPPSNVVTQLSYVPIDSPLTDMFLAERLPHLQWTLPLTGAGQAIPRPMWRTVSWPQMNASSAWSIETPDANFRVQPIPPAFNPLKKGQIDLVRAFTIGDAYKTGEVVAVPGEAAGLFNYYIRNRNGPFTATSAATAPPNPNFWEKCDPKQYFTYAPTTVEISGVVYPAFYVFNNYVAADWSGAYNPNTSTFAPYVTGPILAGDADGDGIADSVYSKLPLGQINGLTYYLAMRVVDNNSAINLNTAWSNQNDFAFGPAADPSWRTGTLPNYGFFPTNTGLREAFISLSLPNLLGEPSQAFFAAAPPSPTRYHNSNNVDDRLSEITRHNLYRFGYVDGTGTFALGLGPAANDVAGAAAANSGTWTFRTQGEALTAQLIRRPENPGIGDNNPANNTIGAADARMRWISLPTDGAALAYRGGTLVNPDTPASGIERRFSAAATGVNALHSQLDSRTPAVSIDSLYISADNNRNDSDVMFGKRSYPLVATTGTGAFLGVNTVVDRWFDANFNFDRWRDTRFTKETTANSEIAGADAYFRSIRPLVVTSNPVSNVIGPRAGVSGTASVPVQVADILNTGALNPNAASLATGFGTTLFLGTGANNFGAPTITGNGTLDAIVGSFSAMRQYRNPGTSSTQSLATTTIPKVSANTAEFGDLWRAYWNVMAENWAEVVQPVGFNMANSGTPFEQEIEAYQTALGANNLVLANPYWGGRFGRADFQINNFEPARTNTSTNANGQLVGSGVIQQVPVIPQPPFTTEILEYNPMRMFRSVIRSFTLLNRNTPQVTASAVRPANYFLRPDQVALLRSALAAANAEDLRDTDFKVTRRTIKLVGTNANGGTTEMAATINGYEPHPFITEVFATTDTVGVRNAGVTGGTPNNGTTTGITEAGVGYVAVELHNPYPFPIDIVNCKIGCINRFDETQQAYAATSTGMYVEDMEERLPATLPRIELRDATSNLSGGAAFLPPTVIPPNGYLVLESYDASSAAGHRPAATRVSGITVSGSSMGLIDSTRVDTGPRVNFAYLPKLDRVMNREMVLLRPVSVDEDTTAPVPFNGFAEMNIGALGGTVRVLRYDDPRIGAAAGPRTRAVDMVPMDSFDFTGLLPSTAIAAEPIGPAVPTHAYTAGKARSWHYVRANESVTMAGAVGTGAWKFVYPGRYDGTRYVKRISAASDGFTAAARQQGTTDSGYWDDDEDSGNPNNPTNPTNPTDPTPPAPQLPGLRAPQQPGAVVDPWENSSTIPINLGRPDGAASHRYSYGNSQRGEFAIPLAHRGAIPFGIGIGGTPRFFPAQIAGAASEIQPAHFPFGGFARNGDLLEVPYIGSYRLQLPAYVGNTTVYTPNPAYTNIGELGDVVFELNPITMDAAMAEDTDVLDDPIVGTVQPDIGFQSREQIGRFVPLRKTWLPTQVGGNDVSTVGATNLNEPPDYNGRTVYVPVSAGEPHAVLYDDMVPNVEGDATVAAYTRTSINRYRWAADLFDYLTVQSPSQDYQPNSVPATVKADNFAIDPTVVHNTLRSSANDAGETNLPFEGLVNINTASERVLAMLPWVPNINGGDLFTFSAPDAEGVSLVATGPDGVADNLQIARAIVRFRSGLEVRWAAVPPAAQTNFRSRPFTSAWDLYRVPELREIQKLFLDPLSTNPAASGRVFLDNRVGDISPYPYEFGSVNFNGKFFGVGEILQSGPVTATGPTYYQCITSHVSTGSDPAGDAANWRATNNVTPLGPSRAMFDYEEQSLLLNRVSNLITTRSDMFTAYVLIEGWENAGTDKAALRVSKRAAFFLDRSQTTPGKIELKAPIPIPTE